MYDQSVAISAYSTKRSNLYKTPTPQLVRIKTDVKKKKKKYE